MSLAVLLSRSLVGLDAPIVRVEVHLARGLPSFGIVGLADAEVRESRERVRAAILSSGFEFPVGRLTVNLSPADIPKESGRFDLPIALGLLLVSGQVEMQRDDPRSQIRADSSADPREVAHAFQGSVSHSVSADLSSWVLAGELSLTGALVSTRGALAIALAVARTQPNATLLLPSDDAADAARVPGLVVLGAKCLADVVAHFNGVAPLQPTPCIPITLNNEPLPCMSDLRGQTIARRALELAAAGGHSMLLSGTPGVGKSMLAKRLAGILPPLTQSESLEVASIATFAGLSGGLGHARPFRAPHHSASLPAMIGGGLKPRPGEVSLSHRGVLFLDELPEFDRRVREALREPLENHEIALARANIKVVYPADFQLLATMNPCPCGWNGHPKRACQCRREQILAYQTRVSGPLIDRIDLQIYVTQESTSWIELPMGESSEVVRQRVEAAWSRQKQRQGVLNARLTDGQIDTHCNMSQQAKVLLERLIRTYFLSARSIQRVRRVARTIADLEGRWTLEPQDFAEAFQYRFKPV
ncbi:YifB family Mg chelatase-like AAA ATPase [Zwartia sp.]|uniref:YifB family Mg chelatase-like AAA ATPase n=1 Tax=Zwartia sp. TaxID=2978004 RepID=UPI002722E076|nr:YifB family Mg chelatase-like AAA ATPase [Zwartia sp.]MDO9024681.1 YifB family Mg chelatase-like AAA ATPase [Zwartia sp.]